MPTHPTVAEIDAQAERHNLRLIGHHSLGGYGNGSRIDMHGRFLLVAHMEGVAFSVLDVQDPSNPVLVHQEPPGAHTRSHKLQVARDVLVVNQELAEPGGRPGIRLLGLDNPVRPRELGFFQTGGEGVHRFWFADGRYAYLPTGMDGYDGRILVVADLSSPAHPLEVGRWWVPGTWRSGGEEPSWPDSDEVGVHGVIAHGDRGYVALWDAGWAILDLSDPSRPRTLSSVNWHPPYGGATHTVLPLPRRQLAVVVDESTEDDCQEGEKLIWIVDIRDETRPVPIATCPVPEGNYCSRGGHFGPHNIHENRPGSHQDDVLIYATYMNAGLRVFDLSNPYGPREVAAYVPPPPAKQRKKTWRPVIQMNDVYVDSSGIIYCTDRYSGGLYVLEYTGPRPQVPAAGLRPPGLDSTSTPRP